MRILFQISMLFFAFACNNANEEMSNDVLMDFDVEMEYEDIIEIPATRQPSSKEAPSAEQISKKVIKTGGIDFQSENIEEDYKKINELLPKFSAYIEDENQSKTSQRINYNLTIRVPSDVYDINLAPIYRYNKLFSVPLWYGKNGFQKVIKSRTVWLPPTSDELDKIREKEKRSCGHLWSKTQYDQ